MEELLREHGLLHVGGLYDIHNVSLVHHVNQALRAHKLFARDTEYIVKDDKIIIIDEFTGRMMEGRRYSEGLHQALEAKEGVTVQNENQTLASITFQNYLPDVSEARRDDRHGDDRGGGIRRYLQARSHRGADQSAGVPRGQRRRGLSLDPREIRRGGPAGYRVPRAAAAGFVRHGQHREIRGAVGAAQEEQGSAQRAERAVSRAGGVYHRAGGPSGRRDDRHQHGRARHRHPARRQSRHALEGRSCVGCGRGRARAPRRRDPRRDRGGARSRARGWRTVRDRQRAA